MTILSSDPNTVPQYNALGQLTKVRYNADQAWTGSPANWDRWVDYDYTDGLLNRYYVNDNGNMRFYGAAGTNHYTGIWGSAAPSYNGNFNLTAYNGFQGVYDAENHLVGGSMQATYDGLGRCVRRTTPSGTMLFTYDGWKPILEWDGAGNWVATNVYGAGADEILARQDSAGHILIYKQDQHGNVMAVLTDDGDVTEKYTFDAFGKPKIFDKWGNERTAGTAVGNRFLFQGREWIAELGIYDYRHRMYQPELGRFLQTDPMGLQTEGEKLTPGQKELFSPGGPATEAFGSSEMNLYRYCGDNPTDKSDPLGLTDEYDYPDPKDAAAARALINRLIAMGDEIGARLQQIRDSNNRILFIPIQKDEAGWKKYNLPSRAKGDATNRTTPDNEARSYGGRPGTGSKVELDPHNWRDPEGHRRDPVEAAGHEGDHAAANAEGKRLPKPDEENRARAFQMQIRRKLQEGK
jgi:RHS repeat-associated protein